MRQANKLAIMLEKQWKSEPDEVRAHYKVLADEQKQEHAEEYPPIHASPTLREEASSFITAVRQTLQSYSGSRRSSDQRRQIKRPESSHGRIAHPH